MSSPERPFEQNVCLNKEASEAAIKAQRGRRLADQSEGPVDGAALLPDVRGRLRHARPRASAVVIAAFILFVGSVYVLLAAIFGRWMGYLVLAVAFFGWMTIQSSTLAVRVLVAGHRRRRPTSVPADPTPRGWWTRRDSIRARSTRSSRRTRAASSRRPIRSDPLQAADVQAASGVIAGLPRRTANEQQGLDPNAFDSIQSTQFSSTTSGSRPPRTAPTRGRAGALRRGRPEHDRHAALLARAGVALLGDVPDRVAAVAHHPHPRCSIVPSERARSSSSAAPRRPGTDRPREGQRKGRIACCTCSPKVPLLDQGSVQFILLTVMIVIVACSSGSRSRADVARALLRTRCS